MFVLLLLILVRVLWLLLVELKQRSLVMVLMVIWVRTTRFILLLLMAHFRFLWRVLPTFLSSVLAVAVGLPLTESGMAAVLALAAWYIPLIFTFQVQQSP